MTDPKQAKPSAGDTTSSQSTRSGPLDGIKVLDLSRVLAAPWSMQILGDMGADIVKIERPGIGDESRQWGPPFLKDKDGNTTRESAYFMSTNRNKRSIAVDLANPEGQKLIRKLAETADICIENFKVGDLARYGLDYASLSKINPRLIYCSVTGFGQDGPWASRPGYDYLFQGMGGIMSVTGERDGVPGGGPQRVGIAMVDLFTGMYSAVAMLGALHHREKTGEGQHLDINLFAVVMAVSGGQLSSLMVGGKIPGRTGNVSPNIGPYGVYPCSDGNFIIASANQPQFVALCKALGHPEWATDPRFSDNGGRMANQEALYELFSQVLRTRTRAEWEEILLEYGVPAGPINNYAQALEHPVAQHQQTRMEFDHPLGVKAPSVRSPLKFSKTPVTYRRPPPMLGQHTVEVLKEMGISDSAIAELERCGAIKR